MSILIPLSVNATVDDVYHALWENVFSVFGVPETIISDVDKIFRSTKWKDLMSKLKVRHKLSTKGPMVKQNENYRKHKHT